MGSQKNISNAGNFSRKWLAIVLAVCLVFACGFSFAGTFGQAPKTASAEPSIALTADEGDATETSEDAGEVSKGDIVDFTLTAKFSAGSGDLSGIVTFTDVLPEHMEFVTGSVTEGDTTVDYTPSLDGVSGAVWAGSGNASGPGSAEAGDFTYDAATRTL